MMQEAELDTADLTRMVNISYKSSFTDSWTYTFLLICHCRVVFCTSDVYGESVHPLWFLLRSLIFPKCFFIGFESLKAEDLYTLWKPFETMCNLWFTNKIWFWFDQTGDEWLRWERISRCCDRRRCSGQGETVEVDSLWQLLEKAT